jgi:hypothetical protein
MVCKTDTDPGVLPGCSSTRRQPELAALHCIMSEAARFRPASSLQPPSIITPLMNPSNSPNRGTANYWLGAVRGIVPALAHLYATLGWFAICYAPRAQNPAVVRSFTHPKCPHGEHWLAEAVFPVPISASQLRHA